jgi:Txe/YoeB family toxin of Txe-Axe toxin-antitoxin module
MRNILFVPKAFDEYQNWIQQDKKIAKKIGE